jgi:long-chain acyl-CoA synthetase
MVTEQIPPSERPTYQRPGVVLRAAGAVIQAAVRIFVRLAFRIETDGTNRLPASGPFLITPNHTSYLDPLALITALPWRQLRRTYWAGWAVLLYRNPMRRLVSRAAQVFPIDPDRDLAAAIDTARALLQEGYSVVWFPEGRRSGTGELQPFQRGVGSLLDATGVPAVPTAIRGAFEAWPRHQRWPHLQRLELRVAFGELLKFGRTANAHDGEKICGILEQSVRGLVEHARAADGLQTGSSHDDERD